MTLRHGGNLLEIALKHNSSPEEWIDLSTGISPFGYPVPDMPAHIFRELPQVSSQLNSVIKNYLKCDDFVFANGTQAIIQALPALPLIKKLKRQIWVPQVGYKEHQKAWHQSGHSVIAYTELPPLEKLSDNAILIVINPNNPSGAFYSNQLLQCYADKLTEVNGWLVVDEAFTEATEESHSLLPFVNESNIVVLRSIGKFFGLAGIRAGLFASMDKRIVNQLQSILGPWHVSGPTQFIVEQALNDSQWQIEQRKRHSRQSERLESILLKYFPLQAIKGCHLFKTVTHSTAEKLHEFLCTQRIYVRLCDEKDAIRIGLPDEIQLEKLDAAFCQWEHVNTGLLKI